MKKIKFAIIGCGAIGKRHFKYLSENQNAEVVGVCDIKQTALQDTIFENTLKFEDANKLIETTQPDIVNICTPHFTHANLAGWAVEKTNVLIEKPMGLNYEECKELVEKAKQHNNKIWVVKQNRYNTAVLKMQEIINRGDIGKILFFNCSVYWNRGNDYYEKSDWRGSINKEGGVLFTIGSHFIDILIMMLGNAQEVKGGYITNIVKKDIEIEDYGNAVLVFDNNVAGNIVWTTAIPNENYEGSITFFGEKGIVKVGGKYLNELLYNGKHFTFNNDKPNDYSSYKGTSSNHNKVFEKIIEQLLNGTEDDNLVEGLEAAQTVKIIQDIYAKIKHTKHG